MPTDIRSSSQNQSATGTAVSVSAPTGTVPGDVVVISVHCNGQTTIVDNNGSTSFTEKINDYKPNVSDGHTASIFERKIIAGDPSTYNFTIGSSGRWSIVAVTIKDVHPDALYDVAPSTANAAGFYDGGVPSYGTTAAAPSITTTHDKSIDFIFGYADDGGGGAMTAPGGYTVRGNPTNEPQVVATAVKSPAGATGTRTLTATSGAAMIALSFAVRVYSKPIIKQISQAVNRASTY